MDIVIVSTSPEHEVIHVDVTGRLVPAATGFVLTLTDPVQLLEAASLGTGAVDWVIWHIDTMPMSEHRTAAFVVAIARNVRGTVFVVLRRDCGRAERIAGHLLRAGARRSAG